MNQIIGFLGLFVLMLAWAPQVYDAIKWGIVPMPYRFLALYIMAGCLLTIYSGTIGDIPFILLNALATLESIICLFAKVMNAGKTVEKIAHRNL